MADDKDGRTGLPDVATLAVAGIAVISAVTGIVGGVTGGVARVARNNLWVLPLAMFLVFVAAGLALRASLASRVPAKGSGPAKTSTTPPQGTEAAPPQPPAETDQQTDQQTAAITANARKSGRFLLASLIVFASAATLVAWALSDSLATPDRPILSAKWTSVSGRWVLSGTAKASGLSTTRQLTIVVFRLVDNGYSAPPSAKPSAMLSSASTASPAPWWTPPPHYVYRGGLVYQQTVGADINGNATVTFEVPLPDGYDGMQVVATLETNYDCPVPQPGATSVQTLKFACLTLDAPHALPSSTPSSTASGSPPA
jgi:hypothetical protein